MSHELSITRIARVGNARNGFRPLEFEKRRPVAPEQSALIDRLGDEIASREWYLARTEPMREMLAVRLLLDAGMAAFCPTKPARRRPSRYTRPKAGAPLVPALPGLILFGAMDRDQDLGRASRCRSVTGIVGNVGADGAFRAIPLRTKDRDGHRLPSDRCPVHWMVRLSSDKPAVERFVEQRVRLMQGDTVRVSIGPWADTEMKVAAIEGRTLRLLAQFFGSERQVMADLWDVEKQLATRNPDA